MMASATKDKRAIPEDMIIDARLKPNSYSERPTPYKLSLCILVQLYVAPDISHLNQTCTYCQLNPKQLSQLQCYLVQAIQNIDSIVEPVLSELFEQITCSVVGGSAIGQYLANVIEGIESPHDLIVLLDSIKEVLLPTDATSSAADVDSSGRPTHVEQNCIFGVFLRRVLLLCNRSFEVLSWLYHQVGIFRDAKSSSQSFSHRIALPIQTSKGHTGRKLKRRSCHSDCNEAEEIEALSDRGARGNIREGASTVCTKPSRRKDKVPDSDPKDDDAFRSFVSRRQLQKHLHHVIKELESLIGVVAKEEIEAHVSAVLAVSPDLPLAHFVRYMNCLAHREYQGAVDSLHTYFDYCMRGSGSGRANLSTSSAATGYIQPDVKTNLATGSRRQQMMQYAVLNLAALHYQFGHRKECLLAIQETVRIAERNGDHVCVSLSLGWLFRLSSSTPENGQETAQLLRRCVSRAREFGLDSVQGLSYLANAQYHLLAPSSIPTAMPPTLRDFAGNSIVGNQNSQKAHFIWQSIDRGVEVSSSYVGNHVQAITNLRDNHGSRHNTLRNTAAREGRNDDYSLTGTHGRGSTATMIAHGDNRRAISMSTPTWHFSQAMTIAGKAELLRSAAWETFGHSSLSWLSAMTHTFYYGELNFSAASDTCAAICRIANAQAKFGDMHSYSADNDQSRDAYVGAFQVLMEAKKIYRDDVNSIIVQTLVYLLQSRAIARQDVLSSISLNSVLQSLTPRNQSVVGIGGNFIDESFHVSTEVQWIDALREMGRLVDAHSLIHELVNTCRGCSFRAVQEMSDLTIAQIFLDSGSTAMTGLLYTLRCISYTEKSSRETVFHCAAIKLAEFFLKMGYVRRAYHILSRALPHISAHGPLKVQGDLHLLVAKCHLLVCSNDMALNKYDSENSNGLKAHAMGVSLACESLESSFAAYERACQTQAMQECLYLIARAHNRLYIDREIFGLSDSKVAQHLSRRDEASRLFFELRERQVYPKSQGIGFLGDDSTLERIACS